MIFDYAKTLQRSDEDIEKWQSRILEINNKLCDKYYDERDNYILVVGSVGRNTAIAKTSDYDVIFKLPNGVYKKFNNYESGGQSQLLQEIRQILLKRYPKTKIKGDGQVVVIEYTDGTLELVPAFEQADGNFKYADTHNEGSWKITKPVPEINQSKKQAKDSTEIFNYLCFLMRQWKNHNGFPFKGLLIDTLVNNFLEGGYDYENEFQLLRNLFTHISLENKNQTYWFALGSNQKIWNDDNGTFIKKANKALKKFEDAEESSEELLKKLFGYKQEEMKSQNEEFIENKFAVDIVYNLKIDCTLSQYGFRPMKLRECIKKNFPLKHGKILEFFIEEHNIPQEISNNIKYYWKVKNVGEEAVGRERGQIFQGKNKLKETSNFNGNHYVECYAVYNNTVVARNKIKVHIDNHHGR